VGSLADNGVTLGEDAGATIGACWVRNQLRMESRRFDRGPSAVEWEDDEEDSQGHQQCQQPIEDPYARVTPTTVNLVGHIPLKSHLGKSDGSDRRSDPNNRCQAGYEVVCTGHPLLLTGFSEALEKRVPDASPAIE
jgi:hypothetical protein